MGRVHRSSRRRSVSRPEQAPPLTYSVAALQRVLGVGRNAAYQLCHELGRRVGRRWIVPRVRVEEWLVSNDRGATASSKGGAR